MKRSVLPFLFFCVFLISAGCGSQPKNAVATDYSVKFQAEISVSNDGFPISIICWIGLRAMIFMKR